MQFLYDLSTEVYPEKILTIRKVQWVVNGNMDSTS